MKIIYTCFAALFSFFSPLRAEVLQSLEEISSEKIVYNIRPIQSDIKHPENVTTKIGPGVTLQGHFLKMFIPYRSFFKIDFQTPKDFSQGKKVELYMNHLCSTIGGKPGGSPVSIAINGELFLSNCDPKSGRLISDTFDITNWVGEGENTIFIKLEGSRSAYWLTHLTISFFGSSGIFMGKALILRSESR